MFTADLYLFEFLICFCLSNSMTLTLGLVFFKSIHFTTVGFQFFVCVIYCFHMFTCLYLHSYILHLFFA